MDLRDILKNRVLIFDGAMGTMLGKYDSELYSFPELLNIQNPELVESIHRRYAQAGADIITTFTIGVNRIKVKDCKYSIAQIVTEACRNAKRAADGAYVALGIGPLCYGLTSIELDHEEMVETYKEIIEVGIREEVDAILYESFVDVLEARTAIITAKAMTQLPIMVTFSMQKNGQTITGDTLEQAVTAVEALGLTAIGLNCTLGPSDLIVKLNQMRTLTKLPIILQPNAGPSKLAGGRRVFMNNVEGFSAALKSCVESGAAVIGGCCGTTPAYIQSISKFKKMYFKFKPLAIKRLVSNAQNIVELQRPILIAEGLTTVRSNAFRTWISALDEGAILKAGHKMVEQGADLLEIVIDQPCDPLFLKQLIGKMGYLLETPLVLGSSRFEILERMVESYPGRCILKGEAFEKPEELRRLLELAKRFGTYVICPIPIHLSPDLQKGSVQKLVEGLLYECMKAGVKDECLIVDFCITGDGPLLKPLEVLLEAMAEMKAKRQLLTFMGISQTARGYTDKEAIETTLFAMALTHGLDLALVDTSNALFKIIQNGYTHLNANETVSSKAPLAASGIRRVHIPAFLKDRAIEGLHNSLYKEKLIPKQEADQHRALRHKRHVIFVFSDEHIGIEGPYELDQCNLKAYSKIYELFEIHHAVEDRNLETLFADDSEIFLIRLTIGSLKEVHSRLKGLLTYSLFYVVTQKPLGLFFEQLNIQPAYSQMGALLKDVIIPQLHKNK